ncbi:MAG TPA: hypothetical protein ENH28_07365 [Euryarchaeota archaeon]|nr:hypothetical protein BMS3Bbin15_01537 [archaeon BMS3Bbin15]HDL15951.1 hypothetical protein [Euryarchaeota archaeon]
MLAAAAEFTGIAMIAVIAGFEGIFCGFSVIYAALALLINENIWKIACTPLASQTINFSALNILYISKNKE